MKKRIVLGKGYLDTTISHHIRLWKKPFKSKSFREVMLDTQRKRFQNAIGKKVRVVIEVL